MAKDGVRRGADRALQRAERSNPPRVIDEIRGVLEQHHLERIGGLDAEIAVDAPKQLRYVAQHAIMIRPRAVRPVSRGFPPPSAGL